MTGMAFSYDENGKATKVPVPEDSVIEEMTSAFMEAVATTDDALMEKFFEGEKFTKEEILKGLCIGIFDGSIYPVYAVSGLTCAGVDQLLYGLAWSAPGAFGYAGEKCTYENGEEGILPCDENGPLAAVCFKTIADPFVGKMSFFKVVSGKLAPDTAAYNFRTGEIEKMGKIVFVKGAKQEDAPAIIAGDIGVVTKMAGVKTGDTLCDPKTYSSSPESISRSRAFRWLLRCRKRVRKKRLPQVLQDLWRRTRQSPLRLTRRQGNRCSRVSANSTLT